MKTTTSLIASALLLALVACHGLPSAAPLPPPPACPTTPPELAPPPGTEVAFALLVDGNGVQRYSCTPSGWSVAIPAAALFTIGGDDARQVIAHFAGPEWLATDGSSVVATKRAGVTVDDTAIQWLDLEVTSHNGTPGILAPITWIQRLSTSGGIAPPAAECDSAHVGTERDVKYSAEYRFYRASPSGSADVRCGT